MEVNEAYVSWHVCLLTAFMMIVFRRQIDLPANKKIPKLNKNCCYVLYTSGSTGSPKGVECSRAGLLCMAAGHVERLHVTEDDVFAQYANVGFDAAYTEIYTNLLVGGAVAVLLKGERGGKGFKQACKKLGVTVIIFVPSLLTAYRREDFPTVKKLISAGEAASKRATDAWAGKDGLVLWNGYGLTETSVSATLYEYHGPGTKIGEDGSDSLPIGPPIPDVSVTIRDNQLQVLPAGNVGEICVGGKNLVFGYIGHAEHLTKTRFVDDPTAPGERIYRTGDQAVETPSGDMMFLGRLDDIVKIRGQLVNTAGVEAMIYRYPGVKFACVVRHQVGQGDARLVAFVSPKDVCERSLLKHMLKNSNCYEVPSHYRMLDVHEFPKNANGKIDKKVLSTDPSVLMPGSEFHKPCLTETEKRLAKIWCELLNISDEVVNEMTKDFTLIEAGGNSITVANLEERIEEVFGVHLKFTELMSLPGLKGMAEAIDKLLAKLEQ